MNDYVSRAAALFDYTRTLRRDFHRHPELGYKEVRTAGIVAQELHKFGLEVTTGVAETGVVALLKGDQSGPVVLVRFDMDALPVIEQTGAEYASMILGVMHACGHDGHVAIGLTVARLLAENRTSLHGTVKFVFQPAEEGGGGAERMVNEGVLSNPHPDCVLALHLWNEKPLGWVSVVPGPFMAGCDYFKARFTGKGGHGAMPQTTSDPVLAAAQWISAVQSVVSRNLSPLQSGVVSVTSMHGGDAFNVIPESVELTGTIRSFEPDVRQLIIERVETLAYGIAGAMGCRAELELHDITPAVINAEAVARRVQTLVPETLPGVELDTHYQTMGSDDMAYLMQDIPGCYFMLGSANAQKGLDASHHHPHFDFDERSLPHAAALMTAAIVDLLENPI